MEFKALVLDLLKVRFLLFTLYHGNLGGGFRHFLFTPIWGNDPI